MQFRWCGAEPLAPLVEGRGWAAGYAFTGGRLLRDRAIAEHLRTHGGDVAEVAARLNGCFAAVVEWPDHTVAVTDRYGSVPLYVAGDGRTVLMGDEPWCVVAAASGSPRLDPVGVADMLRLGYVAGERTLVDGLAVVPSATVRRVGDGSSRDTRYWRFRYPRTEPDLTYEDAALDLVARYGRLGHRIDELVGERRVRLLATGGLDTRVLVGLLATCTSRSVRLVSYGRADEPDVVAGRGLGDALGWPFEYVPIEGDSLDDASLRRAVREVGATSRFTCGAGARAVGDAPDAVTMLGHSGFLSSAASTMNWPANTPAQVRALVYRRHYTWPGSEAAIRRATRDSLRDAWDVSIGETLADLDPTDDPIGSMHWWNTDNRQRKLVVREMQVYGGLGPWMLPLNDHEIVDCFTSLPWSLRLDQQLYARTAVESLLVDAAAAAVEVPRVGAPQLVERSRYRRFRLARALQPVSGVLGTAAMGVAAAVHRRRHGDRVLTSGASPLRHWFRTDPAARQFLLDRVDGLTCAYLDGGALREIVTARAAPEGVFQRLLAGALTVQGCEEEAVRVWHDGASARAAARSDRSPPQ